jgi:hypothetical protein
MALTRAEVNRRYKARKRGEYVEPIHKAGRARVIAIEPGQRFGRLAVVRDLPAETGRRRRAECKCDCGTEKVVNVQCLVSGDTMSCGCLERELTSARRRTHGQSKHPLFSTWRSMLARCENPENSGYRYYGARGITVCAEWHDARNFTTWIDANLGPRPDGRSLDRIDNNGNYEPGNVRWATASEQQRNTRRAVTR